MDQVGRTVALTGCAGFLASHIAARLLRDGFRVRGSVRSLEKQSGYAHLLRLEGAKERLELFEADLHDATAFRKLVDGADFVLHTAISCGPQATAHATCSTRARARRA